MDGIKNNKNCIAAMDLGTNSNRLLIADANGNALYRDVKHVALGDGLAESGCFCREAVERALCSFMDFATMLDVHGVERYRAIATAACRMSKNTAEFIKEVRANSGIDLDVISEYEEARLTLQGARLNAPKDKEYLLVYDLGGGSTEVTLATNTATPEIIGTVSIPLGARNATEIFGLQNYDEAGVLALEAKTTRYMEEFFKRIAGTDYQGKAALIATSSTPLRLVSWHLGRPKYDKFEADGVTVAVKDLEALIGKTLAMPAEERAESVYIGKNRAPIFVAACVIFRTVYRTLGCEFLTASLKSAQEAIIAELKEKGGEASSYRQMEASRRSGQVL